MCGMKPAAAYLLAQLLLPRLPHCVGASQSALQSAGSAQASSRYTLKLAARPLRKKAANSRHAPGWLTLRIASTIGGSAIARIERVAPTEVEVLPAGRDLLKPTRDNKRGDTQRLYFTFLGIRQGGLYAARSRVLLDEPLVVGESRQPHFWW
jgi:hypothetical protein